MSLLDSSKGFNFETQVPRQFWAETNVEGELGSCEVYRRSLYGVYWHWIISDELSMSKGVKQGGVLSSLLFTLYMEWRITATAAECRWGCANKFSLRFYQNKCKSIVSFSWTFSYSIYLKSKALRYVPSEKILEPHAVW